MRTHAAMTDSNEQHDMTDGRARDGGSPGRSPRAGAAVGGRSEASASTPASGPFSRGASSTRVDGVGASASHVTQEQPRYRFAPTWSSRAVRRDGRLRPSIRNAIGVEPGGRASCEGSTAGAPGTGQVPVPSPGAVESTPRGEDAGPRTGSRPIVGVGEPPVATAAPAASSTPASRRAGEPGTSARPAIPIADGLVDDPALPVAPSRPASAGDDASVASAVDREPAFPPRGERPAAGAGERPTGRRRPSRGAIVVGAIAAVAVAVGAVFGVGVLTSAARSGSSTPSVVSATGGVVVGGKPAGSGDASAQSVAAAGQQLPDLDVYVDYSSRDAATFSSVNDLPVHGYVQRGQVRLVVHPVVADPSGPADSYAVRAGGAALCVAQHAPDKFWAYHLALLANLPTQRSNALSDAELVDLATATGVVEENVASCIAQGVYGEWLRESSRELIAAGVGPQHLPFDRQPLVVLGGAAYLGRNDNSTEFRGFVDAALGGSH